MALQIQELLQKKKVLNSQSRNKLFINKHPSPHIYPHSINLYMIYIAGEQICGKALCQLDRETFKEIGIKSIG